ncbi:MAG: cytochrome c3 family protein [Chloroflexota bacterium]
MMKPEREPRWLTLKRLALCAVIAFILTVPLVALDRDGARALDENGCLTCHGTEGLYKTNEAGDKISLFVDEKAVNTAAHRYIDCTTCHTTAPHDVATPLTKLSLAEKCGSCHQYEYKLHLESVHGQQLLQGNPDVATCVDCHSSEGSPHSVIRVLEYNAPTYKKNIANTCARCHDDKELMADYGIVEKVYESYMRSFHGKATDLGTYQIGQQDVATCTNCHGYHDVQSVNDPTSPVVGMDNLLKTCQQCHVDAGPQFVAGFLGHKEASTEHVPAAHYTEIIFRVILTTVIAFGAAVVIAAIVRFSLSRWRK